MTLSEAILKSPVTYEGWRAAYHVVDKEHILMAVWWPGAKTYDTRLARVVKEGGKFKLGAPVGDHNLGALDELKESPDWLVFGAK